MVKNSRLSRIHSIVDNIPILPPCWLMYFVSTGAMIACKLAAMVPDRVLSLALLNVTGGGFECFPKVLSLFRYLAVGCVQFSLN